MNETATALADPLAAYDPPTIVDDDESAAGHHVSHEAALGAECAISTLIDLDIASIDASPLNPRTSIDPAYIAELAASIREIGLLQPIVVRRAGERYTIVSGECRYRACLQLGINTISVLVRAIATDRDHKIAAIEENAKRRDISAIALARAYDGLVQLGMTQQEVADRLGRSRPAVANALRLLQLPADVLDMVERGDLGEAHARAILRYAGFPAVATAVARYAAEYGITSKSLESGEIEYGLRNDLIRNGLMVFTEGRDFERVCGACPFGAFIGNRNNRGLCLKPEHHAEIKAAEERAQETAARKTMEALQKRAANSKPVLAKVAAGEEVKDGTPMLRVENLQYDKYERCEGSGNHVEGCSEACECRTVAIDRGGGVCQICINPGRRKALKGIETRERRKRLRVLEQERVAAWQAAVECDTLPGFGPMLCALAISAWRCIRESPSDVKRAAAKALPADDPVKPLLTTAGYQIKDEDAWRVLAGEPMERVLMLLGELHLRYESQEAIESGNKTPAFKRAAFLLQDPKPERCPLKVEDYRDCPECKGLMKLRGAGRSARPRYECGCGHTEPLQAAAGQAAESEEAA